MKAIDKLHSERTRRAWGGLLSYLNNRPGSRASCDGLTDFFFYWNGFAEKEETSSISHFPDVKREGFRACAAKYQNDFRQVLAFSVSPEFVPRLTERYCDFMNAHVNGLKWTFKPKLQQTSEGWIVAPAQSGKFDSVMAPVARFLLDQEEEWARLGRTIPIRQCQYRECGKNGPGRRFMLAERPRRKRYCSNLCCTLDHRRGRSAAELRDYMWLYRLETTKAGRNKKLAQSQTKERLRRIRAEYPKLAGRAKKLLSGSLDKIPS